MNDKKWYGWKTQPAARAIRILGQIVNVRNNFSAHNNKI
jgi:hypothetical protein